MTGLFQARETLLSLEVALRGYRSRSAIGERNARTPQSRIGVGCSGLRTTYGPTEMHRASVATGAAELALLEAELNAFVDTVLPGLEAALSALGAPPIYRH